MISLSTWRLALPACLAVLSLALGAGAASADPVDPPPFEGGMSFPAIQGPAGSEEYSWTVQLESDQELVQIDDQNAAVIYDGGHTGLQISATAAHDAEGAAVPTSLEVVAPDVIVLAVRHRAGNPAAAGAPFDYPISAGAGWEGGFHTHIVEMPPGVLPPAPPLPACVVPDLRGWKLKAARTWLKGANCTLGKVRGKRANGAKVLKQGRAPGTVLPNGARVAVKLDA